MPTFSSPVERFFSNFKAPDPSSCWFWQSGKNAKGYGMFSYESKTIRATHFAYLWATGNLPEKGKVLMHTCDNSSCVNPAHLVLGTQTQNVADMVAKGRQFKGKRPTVLSSHMERFYERKFPFRVKHQDIFALAAQKRQQRKQRRRVNVDQLCG
jgi:hypothetical protein